MARPLLLTYPGVVYHVMDRGASRQAVFSDHSEFMVLAIQLDDVYRKSILGFARKQSLAGGRLAHVAPTLVSTWCSELPGFVSVGKLVTWRVPMGVTVVVEQKAPSPLTPVSGLL